MTQNFKLIKIDMSKNNDELTKITAKFNIFLPPMILIFQDGKMIKKISGLISKDELKKILTNSR